MKLSSSRRSEPQAEGNVPAFAQSDKAPDEINMVVEIPAGIFIKHETDSDAGFIFVDRFQSTPVAYPANYGSITRTKGDGGHPLDVLVHTRAPVAWWRLRMQRRRL